MNLGIETAPFYSFPGSVKNPEPLQSKAFGFWMWESFVLGFWPKITSFCPEVHVSWINHPMSNDRQTGSMELYKIFCLWSDSTLSWSLQSGSCHGFHSQPHVVSAPSAPNPPSQAAASIRLTRTGRVTYLGCKLQEDIDITWALTAIFYLQKHSHYSFQETPEK